MHASNSLCIQHTHTVCSKILKIREKQGFPFCHVCLSAQHHKQRILRLHSFSNRKNDEQKENKRWGTRDLVLPSGASPPGGGSNGRTRLTRRLGKGSSSGPEAVPLFFFCWETEVGHQPLMKPNQAGFRKPPQHVSLGVQETDWCLSHTRKSKSSPLSQRGGRTDFLIISCTLGISWNKNA